MRRILHLVFFHHKRFAKLFDGSLPDRLLYVQIVFGHIYVCMTDNTLNSGQVYTKRLHLRHIGVSTAVG